MFGSKRRRGLANDAEGASARCERLVDMFAGLASLFGAVAVLVIAAGLWASEPLFVVSSGFALAATFAFAGSARVLEHARRDFATPRPVPAPIAAQRARPRRREAA